MRKARSIVFYARAALAIQATVAAGIIAIVLAGAASQRAGVGPGWMGAVLAVAFMVPVGIIAIGLHWICRPLHTITDAVRKRTLGDRAVRVVPGGPIDLRELATLLNRFADESDRLMTAELERGRLLAQLHQASVRIHKHLRADAIITEAVSAIQEHLAVDLVWVGLITDERLIVAEGAADALGGAADVLKDFPADSVTWIGDIYRHRSSYRVQNLEIAQAEEIPAAIKQILHHHGATSLLLTPFGAGQELLGCLTLLRTDRWRQWAQPEIEAVEALAADIGPALEHARLYEGEQRLVAELQSLDRAKASFLASASHDLRTPLTSIIGYVELLADENAHQVPPERAAMLQGVDRNARRLQGMVEDMLTTSKIELGAFTTNLRPLDLTDLVPAAAAEIRPTAASSGLAVEVKCPDQPIMIDGDPEQLDRLLANLLSNAVKYTPRGGRVVLKLADDDGSAVVTVADTGIGIPKQDQGSLSTRFFRASNAVESAIPGSGLGLSIVSAIAANHHGEVRIESEQERGTTVSVRLPLRAGDLNEDTPHAPS